MIGLIGLAVVLAACSGPVPANPAAPAPGAQAPNAAAPAPSGPKTLRLAVQEPIEALYGDSSNVLREIGDIFNASLTYLDATGTVRPKLAEKIPSVTDGDWKVNPDGSMEVTWKLKPSLKWHDGTPFTAEDLGFSVRVFKDPGSRFSIPRAIRFVDEVSTPDPQTLVLRYRRVFNGAAAASTYEFPPIPRHLLQDLYGQAGAEGLTNSPVWTTGWVGMGPFRMTNHVLGSQVQGEAFADYALGRPPIDQIVVRVIPDPNTIVANLLAGELDGVPNGSLEAVHAAELRTQWEPSGQGTVGVVQNRLRQMQLQYRDATLPWASDVRVRQAAIYLIDRQAIVDAIIYGLTSVADLAALPASQVYPQLERRGFTRYTFDRARGERMLDEAGWVRGPDGLRRNAAGTIFTWNPAVSGEPDVPETLVIVDSFKAAGLRSEPDIIPDSLGSTDANQRRATGHSITRSAGLDQNYWDRFIRSEIASQESRWRGSNTGGYTTPTFEGLYDQWRVALDPSVRLEREIDMHKVLLDDVAYIPLFYNVDVYAHRKGVIGPKPNPSEGRNVTFDIHTWRIE